MKNYVGIDIGGTKMHMMAELENGWAYGADRKLLHAGASPGGDWVFSLAAPLSAGRDWNRCRRPRRGPQPNPIQRYAGAWRRGCGSAR